MSFINNECKNIFADLVDLLHPLGVQLPPELIHSHHLSLQREQKKEKVLQQDRKKVRVSTSVKRSIDDEVRPHSKKKGKRKDANIHSRESLMDLIKSVRQHSD